MSTASRHAKHGGDDGNRSNPSAEPCEVCHWSPTFSRVAFALILLVASGLMVKGVVKLNNEDYGFPTENISLSNLSGVGAG